MPKAEKLSAHMEDYLEAIGAAQEARGVARVRDVSKALSVSKPSVTSALKSLARSGYVSYEPYGAITLTPVGAAAARDIRERHELLTSFLNEILGIDRKTASADACRMEHVISPRTYGRLVTFVARIKSGALR